MGVVVDLDNQINQADGRCLFSAFFFQRASISFITKGKGKGVPRHAEVAQGVPVG